MNQSTILTCPNPGCEFSIETNDTPLAKYIDKRCPVCSCTLFTQYGYKLLQKVRAALVIREVMRKHTDRYVFQRMPEYQIELLWEMLYNHDLTIQWNRGGRSDYATQLSARRWASVHFPTR